MPHQLIKPGTNIDFIGKWRICLAISLGAIAISMAAIPVRHIARGVSSVTLPTAERDIEYFIEVTTVAGETLRSPATAPELNHTVVVLPASR